MNVELQDFIATAPAALLAETRLPGLPTGADPDDRWRSQLRASAAFKNRPVADQKSIFADLERHFYRFDDFCRTPVMSVDDVCQIAAVHEVGAHSFEHATMEFETNDYFREACVVAATTLKADSRSSLRSTHFHTAAPGGIKRKLCAPTISTTFSWLEKDIPIARSGYIPDSRCMQRRPKRREREPQGGLSGAAGPERPRF